MEHFILSINPGSTTTKIAVFRDEAPLFQQKITHAPEELAGCGSLFGQLDLRMDYVLRALADHEIDPDSLAAVVGRGGQLAPLYSGGYRVNDALLAALRSEKAVPHASNLGAAMAYSIAEPRGIPAYIYDAVGSDEFCDVARITGLPEICRQSYCHVLNSKAVARKVAGEMGGRYEERNFIVAHIGGGVSVSAHERGRIVDSIADDAGPFSPERSGSVPLGYVVDICYSGAYTKETFLRKLKQGSGIKGHLGTNDCLEVERRIEAGDRKAARVYEAQAYQVAKGIGEMAPVLCGRVDAVILTGAIARSESIVGEITRRVSYLGPVAVVPGEDELEALALGALRILRGEESFHQYPDRPWEPETGGACSCGMDGL